MSSYIVEMDELSDSHELMNLRPPKIISYFIYFLLLMFLAAVMYAWWGEIEIVVKASGTIRPYDDISRVSNIVGGRIKAINYIQDQHVGKGDLLFEINSEDMKIKIDRIEEQIEDLAGKEENLLLLKESILLEKNFFEPDNIEYYNRYLFYKVSREKLNLEKISTMRKFSSQKNMSSFVAKNELEELESQSKLSELNLQGFESENYILIETELQAARKDLKQLRSDLDSLEQQVELSEIRAPIGGSINKLVDLNIDDYIFSGVEVLHIIPDTAESKKVQISISNKDIAGIEVHDPVSYRLPALPKNEFGVIKGEITSIPADIISSNGGFFIIEGSFNQSSLNSKADEIIQLKNGMFVDVRITVRKRKILFHVLDKIGLLPKEK